MNEYTTEINETGLDKTVAFFRRNILNILIFVIIVVFLFKDIVQIKETGKSFTEIIASSFWSLSIGVLINIIFGKKGIIAGKNTASYRNAKHRYGEEIEKTDDYIEELDGFCDKKNEQRLKMAQIKILRRERIKYDDFENKTIDEVCRTKAQRKCWMRAQKVAIQYLTPDNLLSETDERYEKGKKELTLNEYERHENRSDLISKLAFALIFGYFGVVFVGNYENIIWGVIQISTWLLMAVGRYIQNYNYVVEVYVSKIHRKTNFLIEFNTTMRKGGTNNVQHREL